MVIRGTSFQKKHFTEKGTPCIHYGQIYTKYAHYAYNTISFVGSDISRSPKRAKSGALVMATTSENIEDVGKCVVWLGDEDIIVSNDACYIQHTLNPKYLGYIMQTESFSSYKKKIATGTKVIRINADAIAEFTIPVPSLEEQQRIVSILDKFEALTIDLQSGLPAEIDARRKQYEYYRNKLLTFKQKVA
ncbi:MAG: restriction endonuclease subunit S [Paludibacteraceae bacterium]|nr:restriction endonuclease subunit S [Paludibacteraceae bacterium]